MYSSDRCEVLIFFLFFFVCPVIPVNCYNGFAERLTIRTFLHLIIAIGFLVIQKTGKFLTARHSLHAPRGDGVFVGVTNTLNVICYTVRYISVAVKVKD